MFKLILKIVIIGIAISGLTYFIDKDIYKFLIKEDGIYENLTAIMMLVISIFIAIRLFNGGFKRNKKWIVYNVLLMLLCFFGFGEEISWGQRIFSVESSEFFLNNNAQNETNLHNLKVYGVKLNKVVFSAGFSIAIVFYFIILPILYKKKAFFKNIVDQYGVHIVKLETTLIFIIAAAIIMIIPHGKKWELVETIFVLSFLLSIIDPFNEKEKIF